MAGSRRLKIFRIPSQDLALMFNKRWSCLATGYFTTENPVEIPDGAVVEKVSYEFERDSFNLMVSHESFDEVEPGTRIPSACETSCKITYIPITQSDREQELRAELEKSRSDCSEWSIKFMKLISKLPLEESSQALSE